MATQIADVRVIGGTGFDTFLEDAEEHVVIQGPLFSTRAESRHHIAQGWVP